MFTDQDRQFIFNSFVTYFRANEILRNNRTNTPNIKMTRWWESIMPSGTCFGINRGVKNMFGSREKVCSVCREVVGSGECTMVMLRSCRDVRQLDSKRQNMLTVLLWMRSKNKDMAEIYAEAKHRVKTYPNDRSFIRRKQLEFYGIEE